MEASMATPTGSADVGRIEHEIAQVRDDLGRTVAEIGSRLTPAHLIEQARQSLKDATADTTRAIAQSATGMASGLAARTRDAARDAGERVQAHPILAGVVGAAVGAGLWAARASMRDRKRLIPREWDEPFDRSSRRAATGSGRWLQADHLVPIAAAATAAWLIWRAYLDRAGGGPSPYGVAAYDDVPDYRLE
jgi:hypothetical protein